MREIYNKNELLEYFCSGDEVWLYGVGYIGTLVFEFIRELGLSRKVAGFIVSQSEKDKQQVFHKSIFSLSEFKLKNKNKGRVIICIEDIGIQKGIGDELIDFTKCEVMNLSELCIAELRMFYKEKDEKSGIKRMLSLMEKKIPQRELAFSVHLCEHCNLNCAGCNNFSPLAETEFTDFEIFTNDLTQLAKLSKGSAYRIQLTGGEPLLNKDAIQFAIKARELFPKGRISFVTNGILVKQQEENFYNKCKEYDIEINLTPYPIAIDYKELIRFLENKGVRAIYHPGNDIKVWRKEPIVINACDVNRSKATYNWSNCYMANNCIQLKSGKLSCTKVSCIHHFLNYYNDETKNMYLSDLDFIDIYKVKNIEEIFEFFSKPHPFCKYCNMDSMEYVEWTQSKKIIEEWI